MQALAIEAIPGLIGGLLWLVLLHGLWLGLATAGVVALVFQFRWRLSHRGRRAILLAALGLVAIGPPVLAAAQGLIDWRRPAVDPASDAALVVVVSSARSAGLAPGLVAATAERREVPHRPSIFRRSLGVALDRMIRIVEAARPSALGTWSLIVLGLSAVLALGAGRVGRLCHEAFPAPATVRKKAQRLGRLARLRTVPEVRVHATIGEPCLCGVFRPVVLLPARWLATARPESVDAVLAHELAHARRLDHLLNLAQRVLEVILFFHPGVHWLSRSLRRHSEHCADALAARLTGDPLALARALESMARFRAGPLAPRQLGARFRGEGTSLLPRIQELIGMTPTRPRISAWPFLALPSAAAVALVAASIGFARDEKPRTEAPEAASKTVSDAKPTTPAARLVAAPENDRQISYSVRVIDAAKSNWMEKFKDRLIRYETSHGEMGWLIDQETQTELLKHFMADSRTAACLSPKVTTFENARAMIILGLGSDGESVGSMEGSLSPDPTTEELLNAGGGLRFDLTGSLSSRGTRNTVKVVETAYSDPSDVKKAAGRDGGKIHGDYHRYFYSTSCEIPTDKSLLIFTRGGRRKVGKQSVDFDRVALIKPFRIEPKANPQ